jgi:hypothetical protein
VGLLFLPRLWLNDGIALPYDDFVPLFDMARAQVGIALATAVMYLRILAILDVEPKCIRDRNPRRSLFVKPHDDRFWWAISA